MELPTNEPATPRVDALQDELMTQQSSDGRPPPRQSRLAGWRWVAIVAPLVLLGVVGLAVSYGFTVGSMLAGIALIALMMGASAPVWGAGILRGAEEREARREATSIAGTRSVSARRGSRD